jgi:hypothetical protein
MEVKKFALSDYQKEELKFVYDLFSPANGKISLESAKNLLFRLEEASEKQQFFMSPSIKLSKSEPNSPEFSTSPGLTPFINISSIVTFPNGQNECTFEEFTTMYENIMSQNSYEDLIQHAFALFDIKKTGTFDFRDLQVVADILGESIANDDEAKRLINSINPGSNEGVTFKEFKEFFMNDIKHDENSNQD